MTSFGCLYSSVIGYWYEREIIQHKMLIRLHSIDLQSLLVFKILHWLYAFQKAVKAIISKIDWYHCSILWDTPAVVANREFSRYFTKVCGNREKNKTLGMTMLLTKISRFPDVCLKSLDNKFSYEFSLYFAFYPMFFIHLFVPPSMCLSVQFLSGLFL